MRIAASRFHQDKTALSPEGAVRRLIRTHRKSFLASPKGEKILRLRFGLREKYGDTHTLEEVSQVLT
jgi:DNA-directed RNA polymerase sigma subunit (sigma70/sigma32)